MTKQTAFRVEVGGRTVAGQFTQPATRKRPLHVVMFCRSSESTADAALTEQFYDDLQVALLDAGLAVLRYAPPKLNENTDAGTQAATMVEAACAAARWADLRDDVDHNSIGVLAYGPSALVAVAAASEIRIIRRLCLIDLATQLPMATPENGRGASHVAGNGELMVDSLLHQGGPTALTGFDGEVMFLNAAADRVTPLNSTLAYRRALENHQRVAEHVLIARADHGYQDVSLRAVCAEQATRFFLHR